MSGHMAVDILDSQWVDSIRQSLPIMTSSPLSSEPPTIHMVPMRLRGSDNEAYEPRLVSIGPYHRNKQSLEPMEKHKRRYLQAILSRNPAVRLEDYLVEMKALEAQTRMSYSESIELNSNEFVQMMLLDGCFIVELFVKHRQGGDNDDPIYANKSLLLSVSEDMLLLENQLPYRILQCIFRHVLPNEPPNVKLVDEAIKFFTHLLPLPVNDHISGVESYHHLLHLIHCFCLPSTPKPEESIKLQQLTIPSAEKLQESGIKFKRKEDECSVVEVNFISGVMEIPSLFIDDFANTLFRNFIAFEQSYGNAESYFAAYFTFMNFIIKTWADVEILQGKKILEHGLGSSKEVALLFNKIVKGIFFLDYRKIYCSKLLYDVNKYCNTPRHKWRASLLHDYFKNPWSIVALIAAIVVLFLTAIQSFYAVYAYTRPPHQP